LKLKDRRTGKVVTIRPKVENHMISEQVTKEAIANEYGVSVKDVEIFFAEDFKFPFDSHNHDNHEKIEFKVKLAYKDIVFCQHATGVWNESLLAKLQTKTTEELITANEQLKDQIVKACSNADHLNAVWLTLGGLAILHGEFKDKRKLWKLVADKARKALRDRLTFTGDVDSLVVKMKVELD